MHVVEEELSPKLEAQVIELNKLSNRKLQVRKDLGENFNNLAEMLPEDIYTSLGVGLGESTKLVMNVAKLSSLAVRQGAIGVLGMKDLSKEDIGLYFKILGEKGVNRMKRVMGICMSVLREKDAPSEIGETIDEFMDGIEKEAVVRNIEVPTIEHTGSGDVHYDVTYTKAA